MKDFPKEGERLAYSIPELARKLGVSPAFLRLEAARQKLRLTRLGRRALVRAEEVERYLSAGEGSRHRDDRREPPAAPAAPEGAPQDPRVRVRERRAL